MDSNRNRDSKHENAIRIWESRIKSTNQRELSLNYSNARKSQQKNNLWYNLWINVSATLVYAACYVTNVLRKEKKKTCEMYIFASCKW